jgi:hypothetical protein
MSLVKENQMPSATQRKSDDEKERNNEVDTKPEEAKGGLSHYFVSVFDCSNEYNRNLMTQSASSSTRTAKAGRSMLLPSLQPLLLAHYFLCWT